jgi:HD-like signal output (HDOD) protein
MTTSTSFLSTREQLLEKIRADQSLPTLGVAISKVIEIASSEEDSVSELAHFILSDVALTQQILRIANTVNYITSAGLAVTTISRAIFILGFETIKSTALATLLVEAFKNNRQAQFVRKELMQALCASVAAREIAQKNALSNREEVAVAALFKNIGKVLVASFDHDTYEKIQTLTSHSTLENNDICTGILGCSFERFGESVLRDWHIPETIIQATQYLPQSELRKTNNKQEWIKQVANFSEALAQFIINSNKNDASTNKLLFNVLLRQYGNALDFNAEYLDSIIEKVRKETHELSICLEMKIDEHTDNLLTSDNNSFCDEFMMPAFNSQSLQTSAHHPSGKPINARDLLLSGIQDATQMINSESVKLNDLILLVLETLYTAMGFQFATVCLRDIQKSKYTARLSVGDQFQERQKLFQFSTVDDASIFHLAMQNNVDLMIADAHHEKIQKMLPQWHKSLFPNTQSFIILPLVIDQKPLGFFYADRAMKAIEGVPPDETALIKMLKGLLLNTMLKN